MVLYVTVAEPVPSCKTKSSEPSPSLPPLEEDSPRAELAGVGEGGAGSGVAPAAGVLLGHVQPTSSASEPAQPQELPRDRGLCRLPPYAFSPGPAALSAAVGTAGAQGSGCGFPPGWAGLDAASVGTAGFCPVLGPLCQGGPELQCKVPQSLLSPCPGHTEPLPTWHGDRTLPGDGEGVACAGQTCLSCPPQCLFLGTMLKPGSVTHRSPDF